MLRFLIKASIYYSKSAGAEQANKKEEASSSTVGADKTHQANKKGEASSSTVGAGKTHQAK